MEWWMGITIVTGLACLAIAGVVALTKPTDSSERIATRLAVLGGALVLGTALVQGMGSILR
jgi:hypothetical protein